MHVVLAMLLSSVSPPQPAAPATIVTRLDAVKALAAQAERLVRTGALELPSASVADELLLAATPRR
jgi:hypothetical protein